MRLSDSVSVGGHPHRASDDRFGLALDGEQAWVIDGATSLGGRSLIATHGSDAAWFAACLSRGLAERSSAATASLQAAAALTKVQAEAQERAPGWDAQAAPWQIPSATFMLARDRAGEIELAWVGDCVAIWRDASGRCLRVGGERFLAEPGAGSPANLRGEARLRKLRQDRALVIGNAKFSFTLSGDGRACRSRSIPAAAGGHLLLMSDGFYRLADPLALMNDVELIDAAVEGGLRKLTSLLRQEERRYRKVLARKRHDDATALLLHLRP